MGKKANKVKQTKPTFLYQPYTTIGKDGKEKLVPFYRLVDAGGQTYSSGPNAMSIMGNAIQGAGDMYATGALNDVREEAAQKRNLETLSTMFNPPQSSAPPSYYGYPSVGSTTLQPNDYVYTIDNQPSWSRK